MELVPNEGLGALKFGMTPAEVQEIFGKDYQAFRI